MKYALIVCGLAMMVVLLGACAAGPEPGEILERSRDAMAEVQSYRTSSEFESELPDGVMRGRQSTKWAAPDRWYMKVEFEYHGSEWPDRAMEAIVIGEQVFNRVVDSDEGVWEEVNPPWEVHAALNPRPESYLTVPDLENLRLLDDVVVDGTETFQITGEHRETRTLPERFPERPEGDEVEWVTTYTWLIAKEGYLLVNYVIEQNMGLVRATHRNTWDFYAYNQPVTIELPEMAGK